MISISHSISIQRIKYNGKDHIHGLTEFKKDNDRLIYEFCEVQIYDQVKREYIMSVWSDKNGNYSFPNLNLKDFRFFIIAHHKNGVLNGVIADNIGGEHVDD